MPDAKDVIAWSKCEFCSQPDWLIAEKVSDPDRRMKEVPFHFKCAWARICQVAGREGWSRYDKDLWREICRDRADSNNQPGGDWQPSDWIEHYCPHRREG